MSDAGQITIFALLVIAASLWALYWIIRKAVAAGLRDHEQRATVATDESEPVAPSQPL